MAELLNWILFGALAGWITALMMRSNTERREFIRQILAGGIGAVIGGAAYALFISSQIINGFRGGGLIIVVGCSIAATFVIENLANKLSTSKRG